MKQPTKRPPQPDDMFAIAGDIIDPESPSSGFLGAVCREFNVRAIPRIAMQMVELAVGEGYRYESIRLRDFINDRALIPIGDNPDVAPPTLSQAWECVARLSPPDRSELHIAALTSITEFRDVGLRLLNCAGFDLMPDLGEFRSRVITAGPPRTPGMLMLLCESVMKILSAGGASSVHGIATAISSFSGNLPLDDDFKIVHPGTLCAVIDNPRLPREIRESAATVLCCLPASPALTDHISTHAADWPCCAKWIAGRLNALIAQSA